MPKRFQSTHPSGVRLRSVNIILNSFAFQSTHPSGVRLVCFGLASRFAYFNPRTPVGCDTPEEVIERIREQFQSTHPSGVRPALSSTPCRHRYDFNPRTPVGCDADSIRAQGIKQISIHAPQWGATLSAQAFKAQGEFQSTHPSGVRPYSSRRRNPPSVFQSTHPSGVRHVLSSRQYTARVISIHAPQWGATPAGGWAGRSGRYFNPRTPVGCDSFSSLPHAQSRVFQSTHPSGVRPSGSRRRVRQMNFNPRTPVGCDRNLPSSPLGCSNFNPRTPVGCDAPL